MYSSETFLQMAIQILLLLMGLGAAHALGKLPAFQLVLEDPFSHVFREHLNAHKKYDMNVLLNVLKV